MHSSVCCCEMNCLESVSNPLQMAFVFIGLSDLASSGKEISQCSNWFISFWIVAIEVRMRTERMDCDCDCDCDYDCDCDCMIVSIYILLLYFKLYFAINFYFWMRSNYATSCLISKLRHASKVDSHAFNGFVLRSRRTSSAFCNRSFTVSVTFFVRLAS